MIKKPHFLPMLFTSRRKTPLPWRPSNRTRCRRTGVSSRKPSNTTFSTYCRVCWKIKTAGAQATSKFIEASTHVVLRLRKSSICNVIHLEMKCSELDWRFCTTLLYQ